MYGRPVSASAILARCIRPIRRDIFFTTPRRIPTFATVRSLLALGVIFLSVTVASAQEQEKKLLDRVLKPDMSLQNDAQAKQFVAGGATITKKAPTKSFFLPERKPEKGFWNTTRVSAKEFPTESSRDARTQADLRTRSKLAKVDVPYSTAGYGGVREAVDARKSAQVSDYAGNRAFIARGKSQEALRAQDRPLTIEQVRELLNKNK